ncbi:hypothetical protein HJG60_009100 [Phyllostomus discolor]|uniref:Uncharacterized protein n=1 Tax=Phyllostomus discolor TaxID=89673 RepID=A0A834DFR5_9CHIR|nr:hypothetical protein HJG60_009100 [Phyllostomus discolor]
MSDAQAPLAIPWRSHQLSDHRHMLDSDGNLGSRPCPSFVEIRKFVGRERSSSVLSFNWKEENLLKKKLSFLESMKKYEANAWLREQKTFYKRYQMRLQTLELEHARLLGNKDLVRQLTSQNKLLNYTSSMVDESEAAVKAIIQARAGKECRMRLRGSAGGDRSPSVLSEGPLYQLQAQAPAPPLASLKADWRPERWMTAVTIRGSSSRGKDKPALALSLDALGAPQPGPQPRRLLVDSRRMSTVQSHLTDVDGGRKSQDKFLRYIVLGDREVEHLRKIGPRPRDSLHSLTEVQVAKALLARSRAVLGREFLEHKGAKHLKDSTQSHPWATQVLRTAFPTATWGRAAREQRVGQGPEFLGPREGNIALE